MIYSTTVRTNEDKIILASAEFANSYDLAKRHATAKLSVAEALALAAKLIEAANSVMEKEIAQ